MLTKNGCYLFAAPIFVDGRITLRLAWAPNEEVAAGKFGLENKDLLKRVKSSAFVRYLKTYAVVIEKE